MLVLAPSACIMSGIALSGAFDVFTRSIKFQLPGVAGNSQTDVSLFSYTILPACILLAPLNKFNQAKVHFLFLTIKAGDSSSDSAVAQNDVVKTEKSEDALKERPSKKNRKKEKEHVEKPSVKSQIKKRLLVLPLEASVISILLLVLLGAFYVVLDLFSFFVNSNLFVKNLFYSFSYFFAELIYTYRFN